MLQNAFAGNKNILEVRERVRERERAREGEKWGGGESARTSSNHLAQRSGRQEPALVRAALSRPPPSVAARQAAGTPLPPPRRPPRTPGAGRQPAPGRVAARAVVVAFLPGLEDPVPAGRLVRLRTSTREEKRRGYIQQGKEGLT